MSLEDLDQALTTAKLDHKKAASDHDTATMQLRTALQQLGLASRPALGPGQVVKVPTSFKTSDLGHLADAVISTKAIAAQKKAVLDIADAALKNALKSSKV